MANTRLNADGLSLTVWFALSNYAVNPAKPTVAELNAATNVTESIAFDGYSFGASASNQVSDPSFIDVGNTQTRGFAQFGGAISFFYPGSYTSDVTNANYVTFAALRTPRTVGYIIVRADGIKTAVTTAAIANDFVNVFAVQSDGWDDTVEGENNFKYAITFVGQGNIYTNATVATTVTVVTPVAVGTTAYTVGGKTPLMSYITGRQLYNATNIYGGTPGRFNWATSDASIATVSKNGVVIGVAAGDADITATDPVSGAVSTALSVTIA